MASSVSAGTPVDRPPALIWRHAARALARIEVCSGSVVRPVMNSALPAFRNTFFQSTFRARRSGVRPTICSIAACSVPTRASRNSPSGMVCSISESASRAIGPTSGRRASASSGGTSDSRRGAPSSAPEVVGWTEADTFFPPAIRLRAVEALCQKEYHSIG